jgi:putative membrane protein
MDRTLSTFIARHLTPERVNKFWIVYYTVGLIGFAIPYSRELFKQLIGLSILISAALVFRAHHPRNSRFIFTSLLVFSGGFFVESIGVKTGYIFGKYQYGEVLGPKILQTPLLIGINWWLLIYMVWQIVAQTKVEPVAKLLLGSILMTGYDLFLEPVAMATGMWSWESGLSSIKNYLAWFFLSLIFFGILQILKTKYHNPVATRLFVIQTVFFVLLNIINKISAL